MVNVSSIGYATGSSSWKHYNQAGVAQSVAHLIGSEEVTGSIPVASFFNDFKVCKALKSFFC